MLTYNVEAKSLASKRTKNRIRENGPLFHIGIEMPVICFGGGDVVATLLHSVKNNWVGWVPTDDIIIGMRE